MRWANSTAHLAGQRMRALIAHQRSRVTLLAWCSALRVCVHPREVVQVVHEVLEAVLRLLHLTGES